MGSLFGRRKKDNSAQVAQQQQQQFALQQQQAARDSQMALDRQAADYERQSSDIQNRLKASQALADLEKDELLKGARKAGGGFFGAVSRGTFLGGGSGSSNGNLLG